MRIALIFLIKFYWFFKSKEKPPCCIFRKSCSHYVYDKTCKEGFISGLKALRFRVNNCKYGFELYKDPINKKTYMILPNNKTIDEKEIAERLLR